MFVDGGLASTSEVCTNAGCLAQCLCKEHKEKLDPTVGIGYGNMKMFDSNKCSVCTYNIQTLFG